jgi:cobaltochelatase CobS
LLFPLYFCIFGVPGNFARPKRICKMTFQVASEVQRRAARKLLREAGLPTSEVHRMSYAALATAMETSGIDAARYDALVAAWSAEAGNTPAPAPAPAPFVPATVPGPAPAVSGLDGVLSSMIAAAVAASVPKAPEVDRDMLVRMVADVVNERIPVTLKVEYRGQTREVPGVRHFAFDDVIMALSAGLHVWLPGPAGSGKSTLGRQCFTALDRPVQMTGAISNAFQLYGFKSPSGDPSTLRTPLRVAVEEGHGFIWDDVDRSCPKAFASFNEGLANGYFSFPDGVLKAAPGFQCIATANTYGLGGGSDYVGASRLDKATLDRFCFIDVPYDEKAERNIAGADGLEWCLHVQKVRAAVRRLGLKHLVTPRATFKGLALLGAGMARGKVESAVLYAGLDAETLTRVKGAL